VFHQPLASCLAFPGCICPASYRVQRHTFGNVTSWFSDSIGALVGCLFSTRAPSRCSLNRLGPPLLFVIDPRRGLVAILLECENSDPPGASRSTCYECAIPVVGVTNVEKGLVAGSRILCWKLPPEGQADRRLVARSAWQFRATIKPQRVNTWFTRKSLLISDASAVAKTCFSECPGLPTEGED